MVEESKKQRNSYRQKEIISFPIYLFFLYNKNPKVEGWELFSIYENVGFFYYFSIMF